MRMICPNCSAQYEVDKSVIPDGGRDVQCSNCGHTWFQSHQDLENQPSAEVTAAPPDEAPDEASGTAQEPQHEASAETSTGASTKADEKPDAAPSSEPDDAPPPADEPAKTD
ncbi:MAG: zinc-ribbon domain-containing protein, partial [Paracoccaceae bacterium]